MKVRCIRARAGVEIGDVAEVPDGAEVSPLYWEPAGPASAPSAAPSATTPDGPRPADTKGAAS